MGAPTSLCPSAGTVTVPRATPISAAPTLAVGLEGSSSTSAHWASRRIGAAREPEGCGPGVEAGGWFSLGPAYLSGLSCLHLAEVCARSSVTEFRGPDSEIYFASSKCPGLGSLFTPSHLRHVDRWSGPRTGYNRWPVR